MGMVHSGGVISSYSLFFYKNVVFPAQAEYSYFSADFRLKIFLYYNYIYPFQNLSLGFILKIFLKFRKFQPRYYYKIYFYIKKCIFFVSVSD